MSAQEALADFALLRVDVLSAERLTAEGAAKVARISAALEAALQEADDWTAIRTWLGTDDARDFIIGPSAIGKRGEWTCRLVELHAIGHENDERPSFEIALAEAAAWCRAGLVP